MRILPLAVLVAALPAHARAAAPLTIPSGDVVLPTNARPVFIASDDATFARVVDGQRLQLDVAARPSLRGNVAFIVDPGPLVAGATLVVEGSGAFISTPSAWRVADRVDESAPVVTGELMVVAASTSWCSRRIASTTTAATCSFASRVTRSTRCSSKRPSARASKFGVALPAGPPRNTCLRPFAIDVAAHETPLGEVCVDVGALCCASTPTTPAAALAAMLLGLAAHRRRS